MRKFLAVALTMVAVTFVAVVFFGSAQPTCLPINLSLGVGAPTSSSPSSGSPTSPVPGTGTSPTPPPLPAGLTVQVDGQPIQLDGEQIKIAATTIAEGKVLGIPTRGWVVAIAAAGAESGIRNLGYGDRDSVGPWQMRPSAGWGTIAQIRQVELGARAFYGVAQHTSNPGLVDVPGWERMSIAAAAQAVERSAYPRAYERWTAAAQTIVARLAGTDSSASSAGPECDVSPLDASLDGDCPATTLPAEDLLTRDGLLVLRCVIQQFPRIRDIGTYPGHSPDQSRAVDIMIPSYESASGIALGTSIATWVRGHASELGVDYLIWRERIWSVARASEGWRQCGTAEAGCYSGPDDSAGHRNHVHVSVFGNKGTGPAGADGSLQAGAWHTPVGEPSRVGCGMGCYAGHTGQDFPAPPGTPAYAVNAGIVVRSESITSQGTCAAVPICTVNAAPRISYGNLLVIRLAAGGGEITTWYAHLAERRVRVGDTVRAGQIIGTVGFEGNVRPKGPGGSHLHFEVRRGGNPVDPLPYLRSKGV